MKTGVKSAFLAILLVVAALPAFSANLHLIVFANTEDEGIGCIYDVVNVGSFIRDVQKETGLALKSKVYLTVDKVEPEKLEAIESWAQVVDGWSKKQLDSELKALNPAKDDVVMFYYSGHGGRMSNKKGRWPDMALDGGLVDLQYPIDVISKKPVQPRLAIALGDCCNSFMDRSAEPRTRSGKITSGLKSLFMDASGTVIASGSEPGQYSLGGSDGGVFTNAYFKAAYNPTNADWESVFKAAQQLTMKTSDGQQKAQYEFKGFQAPAPDAIAAAAPAVASAPAAPAASGWGSAQSHGSAAGTAAAEVPVSVSSTDEEEYLGYIPILKGKASGTRKLGASPYPFAELKSASLDGSGEDLVVVMELKSMPKILPFDAEDVPDNYLEYEWAANIDADGDGEDDYSLSLMHFKFEGSEETEAPAIDYCQANLWNIAGGGGRAEELDVEAEIRKNSIVLTASGYREVFSLKKGASVNFGALYYLGGESFIP